MIESANFFVLLLQLALQVLYLFVEILNCLISQFHLHRLLLQVVNQLLIIAGILLYPHSLRFILFLKLPLVCLAIVVIKDLLPVGIARRDIPFLWIFCGLLKMPQPDA